MKKTYIKPYTCLRELAFQAHFLAGSEIRNYQAEGTKGYLSREADNGRFTEDTDETWEWE